MIRNNKITASLARYLFATLTGLAIVFSATAESLHLDKNKQAENTRPVIQTANGPIRGIEKNGLALFLGIPYAAPPVGKLRWMPPAPVANHDLIETNKYGNQCAQSFTFGVFASQSVSEDCLYLNVFAPAKTDLKQKRPVMVWIHGGGHFNGSGDDYDGAKLVQDGHTVVVTFNYRLNVFGFLAHPALDNEGHPFANYGILDQQAALRWVRDNIAQFGGDPDNVTLFGESAGGESTLANMVSPAAHGLFHRGIVESGPVVSPILGNWNKDLPTAETFGKRFADAVGCPDQSAECLRALSAADILKRSGEFQTNQHIVDGAILPLSYAKAFSTGQFNHMPLIMGMNKDEWRWLRGIVEIGSGKPMKAADYPAAIAATFGAKNAEEIIRHYPLSAYPSASVALAAAETDGGFSCPMREMIQDVARYESNTYAYEFMDETAPSYMQPVSFPYGAAHTSEIQYLFPLYHGSTGTPHPLNAGQTHLSDQMVAYWTTFAKNGNPNSKKTPHWPSYKDKSGTDHWQLLQQPKPATAAAGKFASQHQCEFWNSLSK